MFPDAYTKTNPHPESDQAIMNALYLNPMTTPELQSWWLGQRQGRAGNIYPRLMRLHLRGVLSRLKVPGARVVLWWWLPGPDAAWEGQ